MNVVNNFSCACASPLHERSESFFMRLRITYWLIQYLEGFASTDEIVLETIPLLQLLDRTPELLGNTTQIVPLLDLIIRHTIDGIPPIQPRFVSQVNLRPPIMNKLIRPMLQNLLSGSNILTRLINRQT